MALRALLEPGIWPGGNEVVPLPLRPRQVVLAGGRGRHGANVASFDLPELHFCRDHEMRIVPAPNVEMARSAACSCSTFLCLHDSVMIVSDLPDN